jgi:hypothetical protein
MLLFFSRRRLKDKTEAKPSNADVSQNNTEGSKAEGAPYEALDGVYEEIQEGYQRLPLRVPYDLYERPVN